MVRSESFKMTTISWFALSIEHCHQTRLFRVTPDATGNLNVLGSCFGLSNNCHESQSTNVNAHLDNVRCQAGINDIIIICCTLVITSLRAKSPLKSLQLFGYLVATNTTGQFRNVEQLPDLFILDTLPVKNDPEIVSCIRNKQ